MMLGYTTMPKSVDKRQVYPQTLMIRVWEHLVKGKVSARQII
jgi:hypothetical protein